jgi:hypothetical protein
MASISEVARRTGNFKRLEGPPAKLLVSAVIRLRVFKAATPLCMKVARSYPLSKPFAPTKEHAGSR